MKAKKILCRRGTMIGIIMQKDLINRPASAARATRSLTQNLIHT